MITLAQINLVLSMARSKGFVPEEIHVDPVGFSALATLTQPPRQWKPSRIMHALKSLQGRLERWLHVGKDRTAVLICGLPLYPNDKVPEGLMAVRMKHQMSDPNWLTGLLQETSVEAAVSDALKASAREPKAVALDDLHLACQKRCSGGATPSAILVQAMEGIDNVDDVIVLRVCGHGKIDMLTTLPRPYTFGVLHSAVTGMLE